MVMIRDVTAERGTQQNRELQALVANHLEDLIALLDEDLRVVWAFWQARGSGSRVPDRKFYW